MKIVGSNFSPVSSFSSNFLNEWIAAFNAADSINIAVGYASNDSLLYLKRLLEQNGTKQLRLCIGMAYFEGIYQSQFSAAKELNSYLIANKLGEIRFVNQFPFHGKVQLFSEGTEIQKGFIGSSNLSNIVPPSSTMNRGNYEVDVLVDNPTNLLEISEFFDLLWNQGSVSLIDVNNLKVRANPNDLMTSIFDVEEVSDSKLKSIWQASLADSFEIPVKIAPQSNLNAYFGEGRRNKQGFSKPRHWYEVEIIVDQYVQKSAKHYPVNMEFIAYTDDGYKFVLKTSGDYGKNLRSRDDLTVLGRWLKGRMENAGALESGNPVTDEVLRKYGRSTIKLIRTSVEETDDQTGARMHVWILDFGAEE